MRRTSSVSHGLAVFILLSTLSSAADADDALEAANRLREMSYECVLEVRDQALAPLQALVLDPEFVDDKFRGVRIPGRWG